MKTQFIFVLIIFLLFCILISPTNSLAGPYYEGKVISFIVGYPPGGGYDRIARLFARYLVDYIPGKPTIVVENMPGASNVIAANHLYNKAKPDGLSIAILTRALVFAQLLKVGGVKFDLTKFSWIGSPVIESQVLLIRSDLPYKNIDDLRRANKPIFLAGTGPASFNTQFITFLKEYLGLNIKHVEYPGMAEIWLAMQRKEVDGTAGTYTSERIHIERGEARPILRNRISQREIDNLPIDENFTTDPMGKKVMAMHASIGLAGRLVVVPPGTPIDLINILRSAFEKAINDPKLKEDAKKLFMDLEYVSAEKCLEIINNVLNQPADVVKEFSKFVKF